MVLSFRKFIQLHVVAELNDLVNSNIICPNQWPILISPQNIQ